VPGKDRATVVAALSQHVRQLPATLRRSLTWDRRLEMAQHKSFTVATDVQVYFCDPQSPWQRGSNENTNGLLATCRKCGHAAACCKPPADPIPCIFP
jgi:IS30 family transposase